MVSLILDSRQLLVDQGGNLNVGYKLFSIG